MGGSAIIVEKWEKDVPAILMIWYPGMEGGNALARVLFGEVNPSGKLPFTIPVSEEQLPFFDPAAKTIEYGYYQGYTLFDHNDETPAFAFGSGLSYTTFSFDSLTAVNNQTHITARINVTNTGDRPGTETVQLYVGFTDPPVERPEKLLRDFRKVHLEPGETKRISLTFQIKDLARYDPGARQWIVDPGTYRILVGPSSDNDQLISKTISIENESN
jgi:beta-glucosidase